jgi:hypothetical protein
MLLALSSPEETLVEPCERTGDEKALNVDKTKLHIV